MPTDRTNFTPDFDSTIIYASPTPPTTSPAPRQGLCRMSGPQTSDKPTESLSADITEALSVYPY